MKRLAVWGAALLVALVGALLCTSRSMGVPPAAWGLAGLALACLGVVLAVRRHWLAVALCALALAASHDFLRPGITFGHDIPHHAWAVWSLWRGVLEGDWFPRWNPYLSLGIPLLQFYAPLPYLLAWPAQLLGASPTQALAWLMVLGQGATAASLYATTRWLGASRFAGALAAGAAMLAPYHLMDQTFRLALGETMALPLIAPFVVACWRLGGGDRRARLVLGLCAAALLLTHLLSLIMATFWGAAAFGLALWRGRRERSPKGPIAALALTAALTVGGTAAWLLPVLVEMEHTAVSSISRPGRAISHYGVAPTEPLQRALWSRYDIRTRRGDLLTRDQGMPMYFGWALLALVLLAAARPAPTGEPDADPRRWAGLALLALALSVWPLAIALDGFPVLGRIMFPWRLFAPASMLGALAAGLALDAWLPDERRRLGLALGLAALAVDVAPYLGAAQRFDPYEGLVTFRGATPVPVEGVPRDRWARIEDVRLPPSDYDWELALGRRAFPEYMAPKLRQRYGRSSKPPTRAESEFYGATHRIRRGRAEAQVLDPEPMVAHRPEGGEWSGLEQASFDLLPERVRIVLPGGLLAGEVRFTMGWFPGWEASVDGGPWRATHHRSWLQAADVPAGAREVRLRYSAFRPWDRSAGLLLTLATGMGMVWWRRRGG